MKKVTDFLPLMFKCCAVGVLLVIMGRVSQVELLSTVGGVLMTPLTVLAGAACLFVVLLAPAYPFAAAFEKIPERLAWPFIILSIAALLSWWALWWFIATGALADH